MSAQIRPRHVGTRRAPDRDRVLAAARRAVAVEGMAVPLSLIARTAGVGPTAVHRNFPTREALLEAVLALHLDEIADRAERRRGLADPGSAFFALLADIVDTADGRVGLCESLCRGGDWPHTVLSTAALRIGEALRVHLAAAQRTGGVRTDVTVQEVEALLTGCVAMRATGSGGARMARLALEALRTGSAPAVTESGSGDRNRDTGEPARGMRDGGDPPRWCPMCGTALEVRPVGRPARYCGPTCRKRAQRRRDRARTRSA